MKVQGYPTLEKARAVLAALLGRRIVTKHIDTGDKLLWNNSTLNNATDPKKKSIESARFAVRLLKETRLGGSISGSHPVSANLKSGSDYLTLSRV
jgi:hypothetical protein